MNIIDIFITPFVDFSFMQRALGACLLLSCICPTLGIFLIIKRLSLMGEALSHGILPGIVLSYFVWGVWLPGFTIGGICAGLFIAFFSMWLSKKSNINQDATFGGIYLCALALGVLLVSKTNGSINVMHLLFGSVLGIDLCLIKTILITTCISLLVMRIIYKPLMFQTFDPIFMKSIQCGGSRYTTILICLIVPNLVIACQAIGTLMALGLMILPAITARLIHKRLSKIIVSSIVIAMFACYLGLVLSYHLELACGPTIILTLGVCYIITQLTQLKR